MPNGQRIFLLFLFALALLLRVASLSRYRFVGADGGIDGVVLSVSGKNLFSGAGLSFQGRPETIHAPLYPILTGAAWRLVGDLELAGQLVSVLAGVLLVFPVFLLARDLYGARTGRIAAALTAVFPAFVYASTEIRLTSLYALLSLVMAWLMYRHARRPGFAVGLATGAAGALCYLARPEAILFLPLAGLLPFLLGNRRGRLGSRRDAAPTTADNEQAPVECVGAPITITCIKKSGPRSKLAPLLYLAGIALGFALLSSPYLVFLKRHLGHWTLNGRGPFTFVGYFRDDWDKAYFDLYTYPDRARREWRDRGGMTGFLEANFGASLRRLAKNTFSLMSLGNSSQVAKLGLPPAAVNAAVIALFALALGGGARQILRRRWLFRDTFLALFTATVIPYLLLTWQDLRYFYPYFSILIILLAEGCRRWAGWVGGEKGDPSVGRRLLAGAPAGMVLAAMLGGSILLVPMKVRTVPYEYKILGLWMKNHLPGIEKDTVLSRKMGVPFYAGSSHALIHPGSYAEVISFAREIGARYLVVDDWTTPAFRPALAFLLDGAAPPPPELERVHSLVHDGRRIILYRFKSVPGGV